MSRSSAPTAAPRSPARAGCKRPRCACSEQPRPRGRRAARRAGGLRRQRKGGARLAVVRRASARRLKTLRDDETLLVQSGKPVGVLRTHSDAPAGAPRQLQPGRPSGPPGSKFRELEQQGPDDVRPDDRGLAGYTSAPKGSCRAPTRPSSRRASALRQRRLIRALGGHARAWAGWAARSRWRRRWPAPLFSASRSTRRA